MLGVLSYSVQQLMLCWRGLLRPEYILRIRAIFCMPRRRLGLNVKGWFVKPVKNCMVCGRETRIMSAETANEVRMLKFAKDDVWRHVTAPIH